MQRSPHGSAGDPPHGPPGDPPHGSAGDPPHGPPGDPPHGPPGDPPHGPPGDPPHGPPGLEFPPLAELVPHRPPMLLLDALTAAEDTAVAARATIRAGDPFVDGDRASSLLAVELFAQAVAALFAYKSRGGDTPFSGVLLGARDLELLVPFLHVGDTLDVSCRETWASGPVAQYTCTLHRGPERLAGGSITVLRGDLAEGPQDALA